MARRRRLRSVTSHRLNHDHASGEAGDSAVTDDFDQAGGDEETFESLPPAIAQLGVDVQAEYVRAREHLGLGDGLGSRRLVVGRYRLEEQLGHGGMGIVYRAHDPELDRAIAIKLVQAKPFAQPEKLRRRLLREAKVLAKLTHPNVVRVYDCGEHEGEVFLAMEYVEGTTLRDWQRGKATREVLEAYEQAARGLAAAHELGVIHRDFKPDNVLVANDGRVLVGDFGLAGLVARDVGRDGDAGAVVAVGGRMSATRTGSLLGTPMYMAPEQLRGDAATPRSDQFGFCVALWEALTGSRPFEAEQAAELLQRIEEGKPQAVAEVPRRLRAKLLRGLAADPDARFEVLSELADGLLPRPRMLALGSALGLTLVVGLVVGNEMAREPEVEVDVPCVLAEEVGELTKHERWSKLEEVMSDPESEAMLQRFESRLKSMAGQAERLCKENRNDEARAELQQLKRRKSHAESILHDRPVTREKTMTSIELFLEDYWNAPPSRPLDKDVEDELEQALGYLAAGQSGEALGSVEEAIEIAAGRSLELARVLRWKGRVQALAGDHEDALETYRQAYDHAEAVHYDDGRLDIELLIAKTLIMRLGDATRGRYRLEHLEAMMSRLGEASMSLRRADYGELWASILKATGDCGGGAAFWHQVRSLFVRYMSGDFEAAASGHINLARVYELCGRSRTQERFHLERALSLSAGSGGSAARSQAAFALGHWLIQNAAETEWPRAVELLVEARSNPDMEYFALSDLVLVSLNSGDDKKALHWGQELRMLAEQRPSTLLRKRREAWSLIANAYAAAGDLPSFDVARRRFQAEREQEPSVAADRDAVFLDLTAAHLLAEKHPERASLLAQSALEIASQLPDTTERAEYVQAAKDLLAPAERTER